jgi:putative photosynthetic complex assembly protein
VRDSPTSNSPPLTALLAIAALLGATLLLVATARLPSGAAATPQPLSRESVAVDAEAALRFEDRADGAVVILRAVDATVVAVLQPGTHGFVRGVMRGFARDRRSRGLHSGPPFLLTRWADGRLTLSDTATGRSIDLLAFGATQTASFVAILGAASAATG